MGGLLWGSSTLSVINSMILVDKENLLKCHITFDPASDNLTGSIYSYNQSKLNLDSSIPITMCPDISYEVAAVRGNWQTNAFIEDL